MRITDVRRDEYLRVTAKLIDASVAWALFVAFSSFGLRGAGAALGCGWFLLSDKAPEEE